MKLVAVDALGSQVSRIGFGCASLGSRIGARQGREVLERAHDAGITWYDVAPSYGDGAAEAILGDFVSTKRDRVFVCTKVGMNPPRTPLAMRLLRPMSRVVLSRIPSLRKQVSLVIPKPFKVPLSADFIMRSVDESLKRLRTDYVDVLALHRPDHDEIVRDDIVMTCERVIQSGKARAVSVAGCILEDIKNLSESLPYKIVQIANNPFEPNIAGLKKDARFSRTFITYGTFASLAPMVARTVSQNEVLSVLHGLGYRGNVTDVAAAFLVDYAFAANADGVTLFSMFEKQHLDFNLRRLRSHPTLAELSSVIALLDENSRLQ